MNKSGSRPGSGKRLAPIAATQQGGEDADAESIADKYFVCTECLIDGYVQSFVDLFYLTHTTQRSLSNLEGERVEPEISSDKLHFLKHQLTLAEESKREGDLQRVFAAYKALAEHYEAEGDFRTSIYFTEKGLEISKVSGDKEAEADANRSLGLAYEQLGNVNATVQYHETQRALSEIQEDADEYIDANKHLVDAYKAAAEACEQKGELQNAVSLHLKCMEAAKAAEDDLAEGMAYFQLGRVYHSLGQHDESLSHYEKYLQMCRDLDDKVGEGNACYALAGAYEAAGDVPKAIKFLESYYDVAQTTGELASQGEACTRLGVIYHSTGDHANAVHYFEKAFEMSRSLGDQKGVAVARVNLGVARGQAKLSSFMRTVNTNLGVLLKWKNRRTPFDI